MESTLIKSFVSAAILLGLQRSSPVFAPVNPAPTLQGGTPPETAIIPIPLHKPHPSCLEWDAHKKGLQRFLAATEEPADKMQDFMSRREEAYKSRTGKSLLAHEKDWPPEYRKAFDGLNTLITARNNATTELKKIQKTEDQDTFVAALTEGQFIMTYCQKELEI